MTLLARVPAAYADDCLFTDTGAACVQSIGFEWGALKVADWENKFKLLELFVKEHGHARVPVRLNNEKFPKLGVWVMQQRAAYRMRQWILRGQTPRYRVTNKISPERIDRLNSLGFEWSVPAPDAAQAQARAEARSRARAEKRALLKVHFVALCSGHRLPLLVVQPPIPNG